MHPRTSRTITYHPHQYRRRRIDQCWSLVAKDTIRAFLDELNELHPELLKPVDVSLWDGRIRNENEALWVKKMINEPSVNFFSLQSIQSKSQNWQRVDFVKSNLGVGYIFYFVCDRCERLVTKLYMPDGLTLYLCRYCHHIFYPTKTQYNSRISNQTLEDI